MLWEVFHYGFSELGSVAYVYSSNALYFFFLFFKRRTIDNLDKGMFVIVVCLSVTFLFGKALVGAYDDTGSIFFGVAHTLLPS